MRRIFISLLFTAFLLTGVLVNGAAAADIVDIKSHKLKVIISPEDKFLRAVDEITLTKPAYKRFAISLNKNLTIARITCDSKSVKFESGPFEGPDFGEESFGETFKTVKFWLPKGATSFTIRYSGEIYDPMEPSKALGRVRGDYTSGIISPEGVYMSSPTGWYPDTENAVATFHIEVSLPKDWYAVTQGDLLERKIEGGRRVSVWSSDIPYDGVALVANKFHKGTRNVEGVDCSTYLYSDDEKLANSFLDKMEEYLPAYIELFGPYPYSRFDVVENFFSTGYGMPGYTLLGSLVIRMPYAALEGSLAHEMVHCWWGNYVFPDWENGNWCEGLTYYSTNYYWNVLSGNQDEADEFRFMDLLNYTLVVNDENAFPVREFRSKFNAVQGSIGYGKSGAIFGMVHQVLGDEMFFDALKLVVERHGGEVTDWDDFRMIFEEVSGKDLKPFFDSWLDNKSNPGLRFESVEQNRVDDGYSLTARIVQDGKPFHLTAPIVVKTEGETITLTVELGPAPYDFEITLDEPASSIELDPDYYIFRYLSRPEIIPCLSVMLDADARLVIIPETGEGDALEVTDYSKGMGGKKETNVKDLYQEIADSFSESTRTTVKFDTEVTEEDLKSSSILCFGAPRYNSMTSKLADAVGDVLQVTDDGFIIDGTEYNSDGNSVVISVRNPYNDDYDITFYLGNSPQAVYKASYIFYYALYSYVVYEDGTPVTRHKWDRGKGPLYVEFD